MSGTKKSMQCGHCGKLAVFDMRGEGTKHDAVLDERYKDGQDITTWRILECQWCHEPTVEETKTSHEFVTDAVYGWMEPVSSETTILYPQDKTAKALLPHLPKSIEKNYMAALKLQFVEPSASAVLAGRTLEAVCEHEKAPGENLFQKLNNLVRSERIPKTLAQMADQIRQIRNLSAHLDYYDVTEDDVVIIIDFLEAILEYLYVAPAKIADLQERLKKTL